MTNQKETWIERLRYKVDRLIDDGGFIGEWGAIDGETMEKFIASEIQLALSKQREEIREKIDKEKVPKDELAMSEFECGYNQALEDIKKII